MRQHSTAVALFHHAIAERFGLGSTDHKVFDLLRERGAMTGSDLVAITGLTSGAITGVVARLERAGYLRREADPDDARKQILCPEVERLREVHAIFHPLHQDLAVLLESFNVQQLGAIIEFLTRSTELVYHHAALLRAQTFNDAIQTRGGAVKKSSRPEQTRKRGH